MIVIEEEGRIRDVMNNQVRYQTTLTFTAAFVSEYQEDNKTSVRFWVLLVQSSSDFLCYVLRVPRRQHTESDLNGFVDDVIVLLIKSCTGSSNHITHHLHDASFMSRILILVERICQQMYYCQTSKDISLAKSDGFQSISDYNHLLS